MTLRPLVMGSPPAYSDDHGGYEHMVARHRGLAISAEQRLRRSE